MLPEEIRQSLENHFSLQGKVLEIISSRSLGGGSINNAFLLKTSEGQFFLKYNQARHFPLMFEKEAKGLDILRNSQSLRIPDVLHFEEKERLSYLLLEYLESGVQYKHFWESFGRGLANLHKNNAGLFGLDHDNYIGSLPQSNTQHESWSEFFILERLEKQLSMAFDSGNLGKSVKNAFNALFLRLDEIFPQEPPTLLHGDLWSGNYMIGPGGEPVIIDPAVYYGHREMDLGMSKLFGGFHQDFYRWYDQEYPLEKNWEERLDICNLYPLLVHVNLFGGSYSFQVEGIMSRFK